MKTSLIIVMLFMLTGCQCFRVCPAVPEPVAVSPMPALCYPLLRSTDPANRVLECYIKDIITLEGHNKALHKALEPYQK